MSAYSDMIVAATPVNYWRLQDTSGTTAVRTVGGTNGTYSNVTLQQPGLVANDLAGKSVLFNGASSVIAMGGQCGITNVPVSIEFWIKPTGDNTIGLFDSAPGSAYVLRNYGNDNFEWWNADPNLAYNFLKNTLYHVVVCFYYSGSARHIRLFINGQQISTANGSSITSIAITTWRFGDINNGGAGRYAGYMQELAMYNRLLTLDEAAAHYNLGITPATMVYRVNTVPLDVPGVVARSFTVPLAPSGAVCEDAHERGVVQDTGGHNWSYNRIFPIASMGEPTAVTDWSTKAPTGGAVNYGAVSADGYVFWTRANRYIDKVDPNTGVVVATRDFGDGSQLAWQLCAKDVKGTAHVYCTTAYNSANALLHAIKTTDLTDYWTQAWTGCPAGGVYQQYFKVFDTLSGVLIVSTDTSPYYWRCIRDNGATATYLWTSTIATSGAKSCPTNGDDIWGVYSSGGAVQAVKAADGTSAHYAAQTNIVSGTAQVLCNRLGFGVAIIGPSAPYKLRKFQLSDGTTPADYPLDLQMTSGSYTYPIVDQEGLIYVYDATHIYCYDEWFNLQWTYTHPRTIVTFWMDLERNFYVLDQLELRCIQNEDHSTVRWTQALLVPGVYAPISVSDTRIVLYNATHSQGIWIAKNPQYEYVDTFDRDDAASLGADWIDDYFFSDTGAHDFWSIEDGKARSTPVGAVTQGGALCLAAYPTRDIDLRLTCTVGVAPDGAKGSVGLLYRGIDGRTFCSWIYDVNDSGNFKYLYQDNVAAAQGVTTFSANKPTIANGGEIKFRVVLHRQTGYVWINGQGPYEVGTGFLGEGKIGMFAGHTAGSARVSEFRVTGRSNPPYHQTMHAVSRWSEATGYESTGVGALSRQVFRAADGRVMCFWQSLYAATPNAQWRNYWAQATGVDDMTSWGAATVLNTPGNLLTWYGQGSNGWQDENDNVYGLFYCWGSGGIYQNVTFVKFTKIVGGGWTAGSPVTIGSGGVTINGYASICKVPGTGRLWAAIPMWGAAMWMYYSDDEGVNWTQITAPATLLNVSGVPSQLHAWGSKVILVYKPSNPGTTICSKLRDDTLANKNTWGGEVTLYSSQLASEGYHHGLWLLPSNVAAATFILIIRTSDRILRAKKYLDATGWVAGDTTLAVNQRAANYNRSWWDGTRALAVCHHGSVNAPPIWYDPVTNTKVQGHHEAPYYGSSSPPTGCRYTYSLVKRGLGNTGATGIVVVQQAIEDLWLARPQTMPFSILEGRQSTFVIPVETSIVAGFAIGHDLPLAWDGLTEFGTITLPFEYLVNPLFSVFHDLPLEILAGQALRTHPVPWESAATLLQGSKTVLAEWQTMLQGMTDVPLDAWGIWQAILHKWYVRRKDQGEILHLWQVLQKAGIGSLPHSWTVLTEQDQDFPHLWRVIEPQLVILHGKDIQLPFGKIEKVG